MVGRSYHSSRSGRETLPEAQEWSSGLPGGSGVVGMPSRRSGSGQEVLPQFQEWSVGPSGGPGVVKWPTRRFWSGRDAFPEVQESSVGPPRGPGLVGRPSSCLELVNRPSVMSGSGREVLPQFWEWLGVPIMVRE